MERRKLDKLYDGSCGKPQRMLERAVSETPMSADTYGFFVDHVAELDLELLGKLFHARLDEKVEQVERPFVRRLAEIATTATGADVISVADLASKISREAWIEDLVIPLREKVLNYVWYRFVDEARGGELFNALNTGMPKTDRYLGNWDPKKTVFPQFEQDRPEPLVAAVLDRAHDDLAIADFALAKLPLIALLELHPRFPRLITVERIRNVAPSRVASNSEKWIPPEGGPSLPDWMAPRVVERLQHCEDPDEAKFLYDWLFALPPGSHNADRYKLAFVRFKLAITADPMKFEVLRRHTDWTPIIGRHLNTGSAWKTRGQEFIDLCLDVGKGFPPTVLDAALASAAEKDGASADEHRAAILRKVHDVMAKSLVERAAAAIKAGDFDAADLHLSAFTSLDPGSFVRGALHRLKREPNLSSGLVLRIEACEELAGAGGRAPSVEAINEAFFVLTRQKS